MQWPTHSCLHGTLRGPWPAWRSRITHGLSSTVQAMVHGLTSHSVKAQTQLPCTPFRILGSWLWTLLGLPGKAGMAPASLIGAFHLPAPAPSPANQATDSAILQLI